MLEEAFWLLVDVGQYLRCFILFSSLLPPPSGFRVLEFPKVGVEVGPNSLNLGLGLGFNPNPNPKLQGWGGVSSDSGG